MKKADIQSGLVYTNDKGRFRLVTGEGGQFRLYPGQEDGDCIEYVAVVQRKRGLRAETHDCWGLPRRRTRHHFHATRRSFASWAKRRASTEELDALLAAVKEEGVVLFDRSGEEGA